MKIDSIKDLISPVVAAGDFARQEQQKFDFRQRLLKSDGSILTRIDHESEQKLVRDIQALFPGANILAEENVRSFERTTPYTFTIDPIDGTDSFSQGMASWCVAVGLLDSQLEPIAGIVYAPSWDLLFVTDVDQQATLNNDTMTSAARSAVIDKNANLMVSSRICKHLDLRGYPGKIRSFGTTALHLCFPLLYPGVVGSLSDEFHIWDVAASHAIIRSLGHRLEYWNGEEVTYEPIVDGSGVTDVAVSGLPESTAALRNLLQIY